MMIRLGLKWETELGLERKAKNTQKNARLTNGTTEKKLVSINS